MSTDDEYRKQAADAQALADRASRATDKAAWLRIAQGWLSLIRQPPRTRAEEFNEELQARGTHQEDLQGPTSQPTSASFTETKRINLHCPQ